MLNLSSQQLTLFIAESLIGGILWAIMFYYVRKGGNEGNFKGKVGKDRDAQMKKYLDDAMYGGKAAAIVIFLRKVASVGIKQYIV